MTQARGWLLSCLVVAALAGCQPHREEPARVSEEPGRAVLTSEVQPPAPGRARWPIFKAGEDARSGSTVALVKLAHRGGERRLLFVADADDRSLRAIDPDGRSELALTSLAGSPSQLIVGPDGRLYAALRDRNLVVAFAATGRDDGSLAQAFSFRTAAEPVSLALSPDEATLYVACGWGHALEAFSLKAGARAFSIDLPREPRAVLPLRDGRTVLVSHAVGGRLSLIDAASERASARSIVLDGGDIAPPEHCAPAGMSTIPPPRETRRAALQGYALAAFEERAFAPMVLVRPGNPAMRSDGYGGSMEDLPSEIATLAVIEQGGRVVRWSSHVQTATVAEHLRTHMDCLLPRAIVGDSASRSLFVVCQGADAVLELPVDAPDPARAERRRFLVDAGPTGIAIDPASREAYVFSQFVRTVTVLQLGAPRRSANLSTAAGRGVRISLSGSGHDDDAEVALGRALFHRSGDRRIAADGRACASCHPDGRDDGLVWSTPEGPRQPPMLAGRLAGTAPYSWSNGHKTLPEHIATTLERLGGKGLREHQINALAAYLESLPGPPREPPAAAELVERGREVFRSDDVGCTRCHREESGWSDGDVHDILSSKPADRSAKLDTPSLRFVGGTAPYFHDGRYATLREVLAGTNGLMGSTSQLEERDMSALLAYLESL